MAENKYITVAYKLYVKDEDDKEEYLAEECSAEHPFQFISGLGLTLPKFEEAVEGKASGETFDFVIPCADAYGDFEDELMFDVDKKMFERNGVFDAENIYEGNIIPLQGEDGSRFNGTVIEVKENAVTIDLNHPRAGENLHFTGIVVMNRPATNEEVSEMLNYISGQGCCGGGCSGGCGGCGGGSCGDDCGGSCGGCGSK